MLTLQDFKQNFSCHKARILKKHIISSILWANSFEIFEVFWGYWTWLFSFRLFLKLVKVSQNLF